MVIGVSCFDGMASSMRVRNLLEPLIEKDLVTVNNLIYQKDNLEKIGKEGELNNIHFRVIGFRLKNIFSVFGFVFKGMGFLRKRKQKGQKNIIYSYSYPDVKNIFFIIYGRIIGYKVVFDIVEDHKYMAHVGFINKMRIKSSLFFFKYSRNLADAMVGISDHLYKLSRTTTQDKIPSYLIPITVNLRYFTNINTDTNKKELKIFYGGSFGKKDGLEYLVSAFDEVSKVHDNVQLILTGMGHKLDMDRIFSQIDKVQHKERILYKGFLSTEEYYKTLNECDIFCMTRVNSEFANAGFPFKLGEFLASGKAVVATSVGDVPNYLFNDINAMVIKPDSTEELIDALLLLIEDPEKRKVIGAEARKTAEKCFDSDTIGLKLLSIFQAA